MRKKIGWAALMIGSAAALVMPAMARERDGNYNANRSNTYSSRTYNNNGYTNNGYGYNNGYVNNGYGYNNDYGYSSGYADGYRNRQSDRWGADRNHREHERREHQRYYDRDDWR